MLQSFIVYTVSALLLYNFCQTAEKREAYLLAKQHKKLEFLNTWFVFSILLFAIVSGLRYNVGIDYPTYLSEYLQIQQKGFTEREDFEIGFKFISSLFANLGIHFFFYFAFLSILQIGFIFYALKDEKYILKYVCLYIFLGTFYLEWMNGIRQTIVCCLFVLLVKFIVEKNIRKYLLGVALGFLMHKSAILLLPFYFLGYYNGVWNNRKKNLILLAIFIVVGSNPFWTKSLSNLSNILNMIDYGAYAENISHWVDENQMTAWGPSRISILIVQLMIIWYYPSLRRFYNESRRLDLYFMLFFAGVCAYNLLADTSYIFLRPVLYLTTFSLPLFGYTMCYLKRCKKKFSFSMLLIIGCSYMYYMILKFGYFVKSTDEFNLYKFFFDYT